MEIAFFLRGREKCVSLKVIIWVIVYCYVLIINKLPIFCLAASAVEDMQCIVINTICIIKKVKNNEREQDRAYCAWDYGFRSSSDLNAVGNSNRYYGRTVRAVRSAE